MLHLLYCGRMSGDAVDPSPCSRARWAEGLTRTLRPWLGLALVCAGFSLHPKFLHTFWTRDYLPNILQQAGTNIVVAVGMTFVIMTGGIDLSVGSVMALCGVALGLATTTGVPPFIAYLAAAPFGVLVATALVRTAPGRSRREWQGLIAGVIVVIVGGLGVLSLCRGGAVLAVGVCIALGVGVSCGLINGLVITKGSVPPFVATLGMLTAARGITVYATDGNSVSGLPPALGHVGQGAPLVLIALLCAGVGTQLLTRTRMGRYITAIGGNEEASRLSGVNVGLYKTIAYALSGLTAGIAAILLTAKFRLADTGAGANAELSAIAAVVIGGASLSGGQASVPGSLVGALTIAVLNAGLVLVGIPDTLQGVIIGAVIILTVLVDQIQKRRSGTRGGVA
ncbi:MAG: ABC transporter permease [Chthonomonadales bacterium]|nr:ABC transporter permease [Chthonomonadales bacterium]